MIVLDTDAVSMLLRPAPPPALVSRLASTPLWQQATTAITVGELAYGAMRAGRAELYRRARDLLTGVHVLPFDEVAAVAYGTIRADLERAGRPLADPDLRIAAVVRAVGATLITGNVRHFARVPGLAVEDWIRA